MLASSASGEAFLIVAAVLNVGAALLHVGILIGGAPWYRTFGAGESMAQAADAGKLYPSIVTLGVIGTLLVWAAYALSGAGVIARLPYLLPCTCYAAPCSFHYLPSPASTREGLWYGAH